MLFSLKMTRDRSYSQELYKGMLIVRWLFQYASVVNLCSLVLERYFAIVMPFKYVTFMTRERVVQLIFIPWALTIIFILLEASLWIGLNSSFILKIFIWPAIIFYVFLPSCLVSFCLMSMLCIVYKHNRAARILNRQLRFNHRISHKPYEKSPIVMMAIVSSFFLVHSVVIFFSASDWSCLCTASYVCQCYSVSTNYLLQQQRYSIGYCVDQRLFLDVE